ncbi:MAG: threonine synthase [Haloferacaceae archaeon]
MDATLRCYACGTTAGPDGGARCDCGEPYWFDVDAAGFAWPEGGERSMWRYADLLPADPPADLGGGAGGTPLVRAPRLDGAVGARVHVKAEGANPTGSFKDRGSAVGVAAADAAGRDAVGTVSHGNMARSMAAHAASAGLDCVVLVPADVPPERLSLIARHDPAILRVEGDYGRLYHEALRVGRERDVAFVNSDTPLRVAGQKTTGLEVLESFAPGGPDAVVMPVSSGGHASGVWKAFREAAAAGLADPPRLYLVQAAACAPIAEAFERGDDAVTPVEGGETVAYSIANADPPSGTRALAAARATGGGVLAVDDDAILDARAALADRAGLWVESACATALAGARRLGDRGAFEADDDVVLVATGTGYTERDVDGAAPDAPTVPMADLDDAVADRLAGREV